MFIQNACHFAKNKTISVTFYIQKARHLTLRDFTWNFWSWHLYTKSMTLWVMWHLYMQKVGHFAKIKTICVNVRHQFMALKQVDKLNNYHSTTAGQKYKSRYSLESRHWYLSSDAINFHYFHTKGYFLKATFDQNNQLFFSSRHFMAHYESPCLGLKSRF